MEIVRKSLLLNLLKLFIFNIKIIILKKDADILFNFLMKIGILWLLREPNKSIT